jgi:hypothetical protein
MERGYEFWLCFSLIPNEIVSTGEISRENEEGIAAETEGDGVRFLYCSSFCMLSFKMLELFHCLRAQD